MLFYSRFNSKLLYYDTLKPLYNYQRPGQTKTEAAYKYRQTEACKEYSRRYYLTRKEQRQQV